MKTQLIVGAIAVLATACGGSSSGGTASVDTSAKSSASSAPTTTRSGPDGDYVADASGRTLYIFSKDKGTTSTCSGDCAEEWPPYERNGTQVVFAGHPLYYFEGDSSVGDMNGQGVENFGGLWTAVQPDGSAVKTKASDKKPSSGGYSYY